jgi:pimeloyl-ACP methyl ester carboxylesterase
LAGIIMAFAGTKAGGVRFGLNNRTDPMPHAQFTNRIFVAIALFIMFATLTVTSTLAQTIEGTEGKLNVDDGGTGGLPVVFLHSFAGDTSHWSAQLAHLRKTRRAIAIDLRGHGKSDAPANGDYSVEAMVGDVDAVVNNLGLTRFVLVGHSMGGSTAIAYAAAHPDKVAGLVLASAAGKVPGDQAEKIIAAMTADFDKIYGDYWNKLLVGAKPDVLQKLNAGKSAMKPEAALAIIKAIFAFDPVAALNKYPGPKLAIVTPQNNTPADLHVLVKNLPHKEIIGTSHWLHMDKPEEFNVILDEFLNSLPKA